MPNLAPQWNVLETEATRRASNGLATLATEIAVAAGPVEIGADASGRRFLLIPLLDGEAVGEDKAGQAVHFVSMVVDGRRVAALVCLAPALSGVFYRLCEELLRELVRAPSPAKVAREALSRWKALLAPGHTDTLSDARLVGLLAELLCLEALAARGAADALAAWTGPTSGRHDFECGQIALEVKATTIREGRVVGINGVDQLDPAPAESLFLAFHRFENCLKDQGDTIPAVVERLLNAGLAAADLYYKLSGIGYVVADSQEYSQRSFRLVEFAVYDTSTQAFPSITRKTFVGGVLPPGTLRMSYSIDLTNEPPVALDAERVETLWARMAGKR